MGLLLKSLPMVEFDATMAGSAACARHAARVEGTGGGGPEDGRMDHAARTDGSIRKFSVQLLEGGDGREVEGGERGKRRARHICYGSST